MVILAVQLVLSGLIIIVAGVNLTVYADIISERTRLSKAFIGMLFLGLVTSLPELTTTVASAVKENAPDLAVGNVFGSNAINLLILVLINFMNKDGPIAFKPGSAKSHVISAFSGVVIMIVAFSSILAHVKGTMPSVFSMGVGSIIIGVLFIAGFAIIYWHDEDDDLTIDESLDMDNGKKMSLKQAFFGFFICAVGVIIGGLWLTYTGDRLAVSTGLGRTFVGSTIFALITSFPEIVTCIAALKVGGVDMAIGNIFGSNMFNLVLITITDAAYRKGALLSFVSRTHLITALLVIFLTVAVFLGLKTGDKRSVFNMKWMSVVMVISYIAVTYVLFSLR